VSIGTDSIERLNQAIFVRNCEKKGARWERKREIFKYKTDVSNYGIAICIGLIEVLQGVKLKRRTLMSHMFVVAKKY